MSLLSAIANAAANVVRQVQQHQQAQQTQQPAQCPAPTSPPPQQQPNPKAVKLALELVKDTSYDVRDKAIYFGLSTVRDPSDEVIRALLESAMNAIEGETTGRIAWGLRAVPADRLVPFFQPYFDKGGDDAARASQLFSEITSGKPGQVRIKPATEPATQAATPARRP